MRHFDTFVNAKFIPSFGTEHIALRAFQRDPVWRDLYPSQKTLKPRKGSMRDGERSALEARMVSVHSMSSCKCGSSTCNDTESTIPSHCSRLGRERADILLTVRVFSRFWRLVKLAPGGGEIGGLDG